MKAETIEHLSDLLSSHAHSVRFYEEDSLAWMLGRDKRAQIIKRHKDACRRIINKLSECR